jgi:hypothetical protein
MATVVKVRQIRHLLIYRDGETATICAQGKAYESGYLPHSECFCFLLA